MKEQSVVVHKVSWQELCPWTIIFRTLPVATSITVLALALLGTVATPMGWLAGEAMFVNQTMREDPIFMEAIEANRNPWQYLFPADDGLSVSVPFLGVTLDGPQRVFNQFVGPFEHLFSRHVTFSGFLYFLFGCVWSLAVWSFIGVAISRVCLLTIARNEPVALDDAFEFAVEKFRATIGALGIPLLAVAALCVPGFLIGLLMSFDVGAALVSILWIVVLAIGAAIALLLLGLLFGWPLMVASVAAEGQNSFDAMTRSYAYTFQRPLQYLLYMLIAILFGGFCWLIVSTLTERVIDMSWWAASWGANVSNGERVADLRGYSDLLATGDETIERSGAFNFARFFIGLWNQLAMMVAAAFLYGLFWCMSAAVYLLLRKDVDETEMDEVYIVDEKRTYELPPLKSDKNGIPQVQTPVPVNETDVQTDADDSAVD